MRDFSQISSPRVLASLDWLEARALLAVFAVASAVLLLWLLPSAATYAPRGWDGMKAPTAIGILLAVASLTLSRRQRSPLASRASMALAIGLAALGIGVLLTYADVIPVGPGWNRPCPQTAIGLVLVGLSASLVGERGRMLSVIACVNAIVLFGFVMFLLGGHVFGADELIGVSPSNRTSPQTLFCLALLAFFIAARRA
jgi:hypothetical protein